MKINRAFALCASLCLIALPTPQSLGQNNQAPPPAAPDSSHQQPQDQSTKTDLKDLKRKTRELEKQAKQLEKTDRAQKALASAQTRVANMETRVNAFQESNFLGQSTNGPTPYCKPNNDENIHITRGVMDPKEASDAFGRRIGRRFIAYQVTVANKDTNYQYMVHDISVDLSELFHQAPGTYQYAFSSSELSILRGVPEKGQDLDPRNLTLHVLTGIGSVAGAITGLTPHSDVFGPSMGVFNGAFLTSFAGIAPDHTATQLNRLSDSAFAANTVIPKTQSKVFAVFVPESLYLTNKEQDEFWDHPKDFLDNFDLRQATVCVEGTFIAAVSSLSPTVTSTVLTDEQEKNFQNYNGQVSGVFVGQNFSGGTLALSVEDPKGLTGTISGRSDTQAEFTLKFTQPIAPATDIKMTVHKDKVVGQTDLTVKYIPNTPTFTGLVIKSQSAGKVVFTVTGTNFIPLDTVLTVFDQSPDVTAVSSDRTSFDVEVSLPTGYDKAKATANPSLYPATLSSKSLKITVGTKPAPVIQ